MKNENVDDIYTSHPLFLSQEWEECIRQIQKLEKMVEIYAIPINEEAEAELGQIYYHVDHYASWMRRLFRSFGYKGLTRKTAGRAKQFVRSHPSYGWHH